MPIWSELLRELQELFEDVRKKAQAGNPPKPGDPSPFDLLRRKYLRQLVDLTKRPAIVYATAWLESRTTAADPRSISIDLQDVQGFMEACTNIDSREVDLFLLSPGGNPDAAASIVEYLRTRFDHIRCVVPLAAMSAATMLALATDEIVMADHSQLGPIDPQFTVSMPEGPRTAPGQTILDQFELAKQECARDPSVLPAWVPILRSYAPGLIAQCTVQRTLAIDLVSQWLSRFMFKTTPDPQAEGRRVAEWFADFNEFKSHGRRVGLREVKALRLNGVRLEDNDALQDAVLSVHHAYMLTFANTPANKIVENHLGRAWVLSQPQPSGVAVELPMMPTPPPGVPVTPVPAPPQPPSRAERRRKQRGR